MVNKLLLEREPWRNIKMINLDSNFVLGNAVAPPDYPIVYCSDGFCELTGIWFLCWPTVSSEV